MIGLPANLLAAAAHAEKEGRHTYAALMRMAATELSRGADAGAEIGRREPAGDAPPRERSRRTRRDHAGG